MMKTIPDHVCFSASAAFRSQLGQVIWAYLSSFWDSFSLFLVFFLLVAFWVVFGSFWDAFGGPFWVPVGFPGRSEVALESDFLQKVVFLKKRAPLQGEYVSRHLEGTENAPR